MKLPISWLKEYVNLDGISVEELEKKLFDIGFEVEEVIEIGKEISNVVVGEITKIEKHQDSDHLQICLLNCGKFGEEIQIVTGAQNVFEGARVPVALNGSTLAGGVKIKAGKLRGVESNGMLCSGGELGVGEEFFDGAGVDGILILPKETEIGKDIKQVVGLDDFVFDLSITANRPDCQSIIGLAREVSAIFERQLKMPVLEVKQKVENKNALTIHVEENAKERCLRYKAGMLENVEIKTSPAWLRRRLALCDIAPKNNIVDITNYVLLEFGQPMHAFDYANIFGAEINVRMARAGEQIKTLDGKIQNLNQNDLVIADKENPSALAGIMGGENSGVSEETKTVVFESACFAREGIRKTSRRLGLASDSSRRYEKGVDLFTSHTALNRALVLASELNAGDVTTFEFDSLKETPKDVVVNASVKKINNLLGIEIPAEDMKNILTRLNFKVTLNGDELTAVVPEYRTDVSIYQDLAEEIIRIYGYDNIKPTFLKTCAITQGGLSDYQKARLSVMQTLVGQGLSEIKTFSFISQKDLDNFKISGNAKEREAIEIINPLSEDWSIMRRLLAPSMVNIIAKNIKKGVYGARFFELASIYIPKELPLTSFPEEKPILCFGAFGEGEDFFTLKGYVNSVLDFFGTEAEYEKMEKTLPYLHPNQSASLILNGEKIGYIGKLAYDVCEQYEVEKDIFIAEIDYNKLYAVYNKDFSVTPISKFPEINRDLSFVVPEELTSGQIEKAMKEHIKYLTNIQLFDVYKGVQVGENNKSLTYRLTFTPKFEEELTHEEVDKQISKILRNLKEKLNIQIRE